MKITLGQKIRRVRKMELHLTLFELAEKIGVSARTLIKYELDQQIPKQWFMDRLEQIRAEFKSRDIVTQIRNFTQKCRKRLELIRARANRTQREIARILGIDFTLISKWENGLKPPTKWIIRLAELYRTAKEILFPDIFGQKNTTFAEVA